MDRPARSRQQKAWRSAGRARASAVVTAAPVSRRSSACMPSGGVAERSAAQDRQSTGISHDFCKAASFFLPFFSSPYTEESSSLPPSSLPEEILFCHFLKNSHEQMLPLFSPVYRMSPICHSAPRKYAEKTSRSAAPVARFTASSERIRAAKSGRRRQHAGRTPFRRTPPPAMLPRHIMRRQPQGFSLLLAPPASSSDMKGEMLYAVDEGRDACCAFPESEAPFPDARRAHVAGTAGTDARLIEDETSLSSAHFAFHAMPAAAIAKRTAPC